MAHPTSAVLLLALCRVAHAQNNLGGSSDPAKQPNQGFAAGASTMMIVIGLGLISLVVALLVVIGTVSRLRMHLLGPPMGARAGDSASAAEEGRGVRSGIARPVPYLIVQPNGTDIACAYKVDPDYIAEKSKAQAQAAAGDPPMAGAARVARPQFSRRSPLPCHVTSM